MALIRLRWQWTSLDQGTAAAASAAWSINSCSRSSFGAKPVSKKTLRGQFRRKRLGLILWLLLLIIMIGATFDKITASKRISARKEEFFVRVDLFEVRRCTFVFEWESEVLILLTSLTKLVTGITQMGPLWVMLCYLFTPMTYFSEQLNPHLWALIFEKR